MKKHQFLKRLSACALVVIMALTSAPLSGFVETAWSDFAIKASAAEYNGLYYEINDNGITITGCNNSISGELIIPESIEGCQVTIIGDSAFYFCSSLTSVTIPDSVIRIDNWAFSGCSSLTSVTIPDSVTSVGKSAFQDCINLTSVTIGESVASIGWDAFRCCSSLTSVTIPDSVTSIENWTFKSCTSLTSVTIGSGVTSIEKSAFQDCSSLISVTIPENVTSIGEATFYDCSSLTNITILNPDCNIFNSKHTISDTAAIHGYANSTAQKYAQKYGRKFVTIEAGVNEHLYTSSIKLSKTSYTYNGKVQKPTVTVKNSKGTTLKNGTDYTVSYASGCKNTGKYAVKITFKGNYSGTKTLYFNILPSKTSKLSASQTTTSIKATWKAVTGATGYKVTLYNAKGKAVKTVDTTKTTYTFSKLSKGTTYKVRVTAYKTIDGKKVASSVYTQITTATKPGTPSLKVTAGTKKASLSWNKQTGASGYAVYMATSKNGTYKKVATVKGGTKTSYTKTGLTKGKTYYFKVAAYTVVDGQTISGEFSSVKSAKIK